MANLTTAPRAADDAAVVSQLERFERRIKATPPGTCPVALQASLLEAAAAQTCGKCTPCRDGLPQLAALLRKVRDCEACTDDLAAIRTLAQFAREASDCAIGYEAGQAALDGLDLFAAEYASHIEEGACRSGVGQTLPCETDCPAHIDIPGYIALAAEGDFAGAVNMIRKDNPFPTACAFVCEHPCEARCRRGLIDAPVNIRGIKRYAVDGCAADAAATPAPLPSTGRRIAVVGGGPSGLTCAYYLALMGHAVEVFEARKQLGGMMRYGIPAYRFPRERLDEDIRAVVGAGDITVHLETPVDAARMSEIVATFDAVYVAIGAQAGKTLAVEGGAAAGTMSAVSMLGRIGDGDYPDFSGKDVVVIGGGNVAMDCARTAVRAGAESVTVVYRRRLEDMTALAEEVESAIAEGVEMITLEAPRVIECDTAGRVAALITQPQMIGPVKNGRPAPIPVAKPAHHIPADVVLIAVGQDIVSAPFEEAGLAVERGRLVTDEHLAVPNLPGVFAGGDCQTGPATVIKAIGAGKVAARNIDAYLGFNHTLDCGVTAPEPHLNDRTPTGRVNLAERPARERKHDFDGVECPMTPEEAAQECARCLRCDHFGCGILEKGRIQYA